MCHIGQFFLSITLKIYIFATNLGGNDQFFIAFRRFKR